MTSFDAQQHLLKEFLQSFRTILLVAKHFLNSVKGSVLKVDMAQAQLHFTDESLEILRGYGFENVVWSPVSKTITCQLDDTFSLVIKKTHQNVSIRLRKLTQSMSLPYNLFETLCDLKESIQLLSSFVEGNSK